MTTFLLTSYRETFSVIHYIQRLLDDIAEEKIKRVCEGVEQKNWRSIRRQIDDDVNMSFEGNERHPFVTKLWNRLKG